MVRQLLYQKNSHLESLEKYIDSFLPPFSIDDVEKFDLYANKNSKYLFYRFNDYVKAYGNKRRKIKHTQKMKDSIGLQKIAKKRLTISCRKNSFC